jgi:hypothetical protein
LLRSRLDNNISEAAYTGKAKDYADEFARISSAVRQLQKDHHELDAVIERLQMAEKQHWGIVLELHRVELALAKHSQNVVETEHDDEHNHHHHHHHHHHHDANDDDDADDDEGGDWHVMRRQRSELISRRIAVQETIMEVLDDL